jgi:hypothetical protein
MTSDNITLDGNVLFNVQPRGISALDNYVDPNGGMIICGYNYPDRCSNIKVINNLVMGVKYAGIGTMGRSCDNTNDLAFKNNVVHSVQGMGAIIYPN